MIFQKSFFQRANFHSLFISYLSNFHIHCFYKLGGPYYVQVAYAEKPAVKISHLRCFGRESKEIWERNTDKSKKFDFPDPGLFSMKCYDLPKWNQNAPVLGISELSIDLSGLKLE